MSNINFANEEVPLHEKNSDTAPFSETNTAVNLKLDTITILNQIAETMLHVFDATSVYIGDWQPTRNTSTIIAESFSDEAKPEERESDLGVTYNLLDLETSLNWLREKKAYYYHFDNPNESKWNREHMQKYGCITTLVVPLSLENHIMGYVEIWESRYRREYSQKELDLAQQLAQQATIALLNAQLYQIEAKRRREGEIVQEIAGYLTSTLHLDEVLTRVIDILRSYLANIQSCAITVLEQDGRFLKKYKGWAEQPEYATFAEGEGILVENAFVSRLALEQKEPIVISDLTKYPFADKRTKAIIDQGLRAILYVPLLIREEPIGLLHISVWGNPRKFSQEEIALTQTVANQASIAIENANLFAAERHRLKLAQIMQQIGSLLTTSIRIEEVYERIFDLLQNVISFTSVSIQLIDEKTNLFYLAASRGFEDIELIKQNTAKHSIYLTSKIPIPPGWAVIPNTAKSDLWIEENIKTDIRSWIGAGLFIQDKMIGILNVDNSTPDVYDETDGQTIAIFANQAAIAIENARLYDKTRQQAEEVAILHLIAQTTAVTLNIDRLLQQTTELITQKKYPYIFGFYMVDEKNNTLSPHRSVHGINPDFYNNNLPINNQTIIGRVAVSGQPYLNNHVYSDPDYKPIDPNTKSKIMIPVIVNHKVIAVIDAESPEKNAFSQKDYDFLMTLSANVAAAIERATLYTTLRNQANNLTQQVAQQTSKLAEERDRTLSILESAGEGILLIDTEAKIRYVNPALEKQSGYTLEELTGQSIDILDGSTMTEKASKIIKEAQHQQWSGERRNKRKDGSLYDVSAIISPVTDDFGNVTGYVSVYSDISRIKEVDRLKATFISNISHELRTPLTNIKMYISLLEKGKQENFSRYFKVLHQESKRLDRLIQGLLDISRLETSFAVDPDVQIDIRPLLQEAVEDIKPDANNKEIAIHITLPETTTPFPNAIMKDAHFNTIVKNIIDNAVRFSPPQTEINISVGYVDLSDQAFIWIRVQDNGWGIPKTEQTLIYDRFFRGQTAFDRNISGSGLGLAIVKETIKGYNGRIELTSAEGKGSTFTIWIPAATESSAPSTSTSPLSRPPNPGLQ